MQFTPIAIAGAYQIELEPRSDERGFFARAWCQQEFAAHGLATNFVQANLSSNLRKGTLRGMHYQLAPHAEAKLVRALRGAIFDVIVDLRPDSPTFRHWAGVELSGANRRALYLPEGCAHGFQTLEDDSDVFYQVSAFYAPGVEAGVAYNDPAFAIAWPLPVSVISAKDQSWAPFAA